MQCFPPEKHVSPRQMFCVHCICTPAPSPSQLSSAVSQLPMHCLHTALQHCSLSRAGDGAGSKFSEHNTVLQGFRSCLICTHIMHSARVARESFTSIHAKCSALFIAYWEAHGVIAETEEALSALILCLSAFITEAYLWVPSNSKQLLHK